MQKTGIILVYHMYYFICSPNQTFFFLLLRNFLIQNVELHGDEHVIKSCEILVLASEDATTLQEKTNRC